MYNIRALDNKFGSLAIVTAMGYESPLSSLKNIENEIARNIGQQLDGEVLFDLVCSNGLEWNRFMSVKIERGSFVRSSVKVVESSLIASQIIKQQSITFRENPQFLEGSIVSSEEILLIVA